MELTLNRFGFYDASTIGRLNINGFFFCYTLEDVVRPDGYKIPGQTAIPAGRYQVIVNRSPKFQRDLPLLLAVPDFTGIRIHSGNNSKNTAGCILVGRTYSNDFVGNSRRIENELVKKLKGARMNEGHWLSILNLAENV